MADSTWQTDHPFCVHLEDDVSEMELTMHWHRSNPLHNQQLHLLLHPHQLLQDQDLQGIYCTPHLTVSILYVAYPDTSSLLDINPSVFMTTMTLTSDHAPMPVIVDVEFQPYVVKAWAHFQTDRISKEKCQK